MPILKRILVATDLSATAHAAVMRAGQLARQWEANLFLVHARPDWNLFARWAPASQDSYRDISQSAETPLRDLLAELERKFGVHARCDSRMGKASSVIATAAAEWQPHLVVIGARGEHDACGPEPFLGGTALKLLSRIELPMLVVRGSSEDAYTTSLVAVGIPSALSRRAVLWASGLVKGGDCHLVHAYGVPYVERMRLRGIADAVVDARMRQAREAAELTPPDIIGAAEGSARMHVHAVNGEPVAAVLAEVRRYAPQLVVIGKCESPALAARGSIMGGVGFLIAYHAPTDVLILS
jgi:nucleotide-binding universal stress UspA family protein